MAKILVIDDEKIMRILIKTVLDAENHDVSVAVDGLEGLELFKSERFDLVITDIIMPNKTGIDVIYEVSQRSENTPVIAISGGCDSLINRDLALTSAEFAGAKAILKKPIIADELCSTVSMVLTTI